MRVHDNDFGAFIGRLEGIEEVTVGETNAVFIMNSGTLPCFDGLCESVSDFVTFGTESINNISSSELLILLGTCLRVIGLENLGATSGDFGISECEHNFLV
jgi:hypothetical protein